MQYFHLKDRSPNSLARPIIRILYGSVLLLASMLLSGCSEAKITKTTYSIPKPVLEDLDHRVALQQKRDKLEAEKQAAFKPQRMLAAFVPDKKKSKFWTAKLVGEPDVAAKVADDFTSFIKSWSFSESEELPKWTLPKDWDVQSFSDGAGSVAKVYLAVGDEPLTITISNFTLQGDPAMMAVQNINRWRNQLTLGPLNKANLEKETTAIELDGEKAYIMNEVGKFTGRMPLPTRTPAPKSDAPAKSESKEPAKQAPEIKDSKESDPAKEKPDNETPAKEKSDSPTPSDKKS